MKVSKSKKTTDIATILVRLTIVGDRKKANPYAIVFRVARKNNVSADGFLDWFEKLGGIERIRLSKTPISNKPTDAQTQAVRNIGIQYVKQQTALATVSFDNSVDFDSEIALLVVSKTSNSVELVEILDSENSATKAYLTRLGSQQNAQQQQPSSPPQLPGKTQP